MKKTDEGHSRRLEHMQKHTLVLDRITKHDNNHLILTYRFNAIFGM